MAMAFTSAVVERTPLHRTMFNVGTALLAASAARLTFDALTGGLSPDTVLSHVVLPAIFAGQLIRDAFPYV